MSYHLYQTEGFIIDSRLLGESNKLFFLLTPELGLVMASAQGVRKLDSKLQPHLDQYSYGKFNLVRGREVWRLVGASKEEAFRGLFADPEKRAAAARIFSLLRLYVIGEGTASRLCGDLKEALLFLEQTTISASLLPVWEMIVVMRILDTLGYLKAEPSLQPFLSFTVWEESLLSDFSSVRSLAARLINLALTHSHL